LRKEYCSAEEVASTDVQTKLLWNKTGAIQSLEVVVEKKIACFYKLDKQLFRIWPQHILGKREEPFFANFYIYEIQ
jgi:hypothetical protein